MGLVITLGHSWFSHGIGRVVNCGVSYGISSGVNLVVGHGVGHWVDHAIILLLGYSWQKKKRKNC